MWVNVLSVTTAILALVTLFMLCQLQDSARRLDAKLKEVDNTSQAEANAISQATLAAAQQAAWDAAWARRLASTPIYAPLYRPRYHHRRRHHKAPEELPAGEMVVEEEVIA